MKRSIFIGFDPREAAAFAVAREGALKSVEADHPEEPIPVYGLVLDRLRAAGLYWRPTRYIDGGRLWDVISEAPMSTEFACSRFLTPHLAKEGWSLFMDCDMLPRGDLRELFSKVERDYADKAIACVKHNFAPPEGVKMDGQMQTVYARKNWTSFCFFNCDHPANKALTVDLINTVPGRDLHRFCWIEDDDLIAGLPPEWNWLAGHDDPEIEPKNIHWTDGIPLMKGYENAPYAGLFMEELHDWAEGQLSLPG